MSGEMVPNSMEIPTSIVRSPRYIGFLVNLKGPVVTTRVGFVPGVVLVPNFRKYMALPTLRENPDRIKTIPINLHG